MLKYFIPDSEDLDFKLKKMKFISVANENIEGKDGVTLLLKIQVKWKYFMISLYQLIKN